MIFRRIKAHIEKENWFAVGIDFLIVVFGVFIGIQVANWNTARADRADNFLYMQRLHDEMGAVDAANIPILLELNETVRLLTEVAGIVSSDVPTGPLTRDQCDAVFASHIYRPGRVSIPTIEELIASGRASVISDDTLRRDILRLTQLRRATDDFNGRISNDALELHRKYPEVIILNSTLTYDRFGSAPYGGHKCHLELMKNNPGFKNDLIDNLYRMDSFVKLVNEPEIAVLSDIHRSLDRILGFDHSNGKPG